MGINDMQIAYIYIYNWLYTDNFLFLRTSKRQNDQFFNHHNSTALRALPNIECRDKKLPQVAVFGKQIVVKE